MARRNPTLDQVEFHAAVAAIATLLGGLHIAQIEHVLSTVRKLIGVSTVFDATAPEFLRRVEMERPGGDEPPN